MKVSRTIRLDKELSDRLDAICERHGDLTWHIENALRHYLGGHNIGKKEASDEHRR